jgi:DNA polymerase elongation subunit (family B)
VYSWACEENEQTLIRIYGLNEENKTICLRIENFTPYIYVELPENDYENAAVIIKRQIFDNILTGKVEFKNHLYNCYNGENPKPFLFCTCNSRKQINIIHTKLKTKYKIHEQSATSILQLMALRNINAATWLHFTGSLVKNDNKITSTDEEYVVKWKKLNPSTKTSLVSPKILAFDLEVNSEITSAMPSNRLNDVIFQISCVIKNKEKRKILLTINGDDLDSKILHDIEVRAYETEEELICGFIDLINEEKPNVMTGYNILGFDISYLIQRANRFFLLDSLKLIGFNKILPAHEEKIEWGSSAYKHQKYVFLNWEGILLIDLYPIIKRDYKLDNYKLQTVATFFLNAEKDPFTPQDIFRSYRERKMSEVGKYCVQDSNLCIDLMDHLHCWISLSEMSKVCNVPMFSLYTQGQQGKVFAQVYKYCLRENIVVDSDGYSCRPGEKYMGAYVLEPTPGYYDKVVPLDFCSLYPSIMIGYNICYSTFITDKNIPDEQCQIFEWEDHIFCEHDPNIIEIQKYTNQIDEIGSKINIKIKERDVLKSVEARKLIQRDINLLRETQRPLRDLRNNHKKIITKDYTDFEGNVISGIMCEKRRYRFYKPEIKKGVMPIIIQHLLDSRKLIKTKLKMCHEDEKIVLDKEQLAYKISANSQYGAMGVRRGYLPFMPGAMCVTYLGRKIIKETQSIITEKYGGNVIYGDTDSNYVRFPHILDVRKLWDYSNYVAREVSLNFPSPITLDFEQTIYDKFLILSKKRYMFQSMTKDGELDEKIGRKGIVLARRDNTGMLRFIYEKLIVMIFNKESKKDIERELLNFIDKIFCHNLDDKYYVATVEVGDSSGEIENGKLGDYKIRFTKKTEGLSERERAIKSCPAHIQLAEKMRKRGCPIDAGSRLEYVVMRDTRSTTLGSKLEDYEYYTKWKMYVELDKLYYLKKLITPLDQLLFVGLDIPSYVETLYDYRCAKQKLIDEYKKLLSSRIKY